LGVLTSCAGDLNVDFLIKWENFQAQVIYCFAFALRGEKADTKKAGSAGFFSECLDIS